MLKTMMLSSLSKVFSDEEPKDAILEHFSMLKGERSSFQMAFCSDEDMCADVKVSGWEENERKVYLVKEIHSDFPAYPDSDDYFLRKEPGEFPELLMPIEGKIEIKKGLWYSIWIELDAKNIKAGKKELTVEIICENETVTGKMDVEVMDAVLPEQDLICTMWFHCDCLATHYNVEAFSEEHWRILENYIKNAAEHGVNLLLTPLFTPALDTEVGGERLTVQLVDVTKDGDNYTFNFDKLKRWFEMCMNCGIKYFEMSHFYTQWGALHAPKVVANVNGKEKKIFGWKTWAGGKDYNNFLTQLSKELIKFIDEMGIRDRIYFHVSDEPSLNNYRIYKKRAAVIRSLFPGFKIIDALSDVKFFNKGVVEYPIPANNHAEHFVGKTKEFWTYYCCAQHQEDVANRFFSMPSQRSRILGTQLYIYEAVGFLQWGYNFWYKQFSKGAINPYEVTDAGNAFPSGDAFVVYPAEDGTPLNSLRLKVFYDAIEDLRALKLLESKIGRDKVLELIENEAGQKITLKSYPKSQEFILNLREKVNEAIKEN